jgi:hypothetical protein
MSETDTIVFQDLEASTEGVVIVRSDAGRVELTVSIRSGADVSVVFDERVAQRLAVALQKAVA